MVVPAAALPLAIMSRFPTGWVMLTGVDVPGDWTDPASHEASTPPGTGAGSPASSTPTGAPPPAPSPTPGSPSAPTVAATPPEFPAGLLSHLLEDQ
jgi:hypothetical protein